MSDSTEREEHTYNSTNGITIAKCNTTWIPSDDIPKKVEYNRAYRRKHNKDNK